MIKMLKNLMLFYLVVIDVIKNIELFEVVYGINNYYELGQYYGNGNNENY